ncbi:alcohol dehydrogenase catalytic domain-containing protein [Asanoa sp. WMMD1127]|uniref:alcohol dehydrogenase catalytic domain-containing protein n=1 Tax=Asanoa sp. WMMD1127 TaxID=3016107 RepID=UPI0024179EA1|nr:zinc-binding dehydrogenase [Asanoa sp. WMMD1127]MDG4824150.1 alcohol dehydrogenase catalytic domain-containing protein [Asanoa sp. WMMD1127]
MRRAVLTGPGRFEIEEVARPAPAPDEVLVRVAACGVCSSELAGFAGDAGDYPRFIGHEVSGTVVEAGPEVTTLGPGDPVGCWVTSHGYAEFVTVKAAWCFPAGGVPLDEALAEPLACAVNAVEETDVRLGDDVVLIGAGFMGNLVQALVGLRGPRQLIVADTRPDALARAATLGATRVVDVRSESLAAVVAEETGGRGADVTFEATGSQGALDVVGETTRMSGKLVLVGFHQGAARRINLAHWNWMAFGIVNAHYRDVDAIMRGMSVGMRLLTAGRLSLAPLVSHRFPLDRVNEAFETARAKPEGFVKAVVTM